MNDELNKLYTALIGKGYTTDDLGDENTFRSMMSDKNNRKDLYDYVSERGDFRIGGYDAYEQRLTSQPIDKSQYTLTAEQLGLEDSTNAGGSATLPTENRNQDIFAGRESMAHYADKAQNLRKAKAAYNMNSTAENAEKLDSAAREFSIVETSRLNAEKEKRTRDELLAERKRLEDAKREAELRLRTRRGEIASPSGMYQMGMAPVTGNQAAEIADPEMTKLYAAVNSYDNAIRSVDRKLSGDEPGFWEGVADATVRNPGFYTMGLIDMSDARGMLDIAQNGIEGREDELLADALYSKNAEQQDEDFGFLYRAGNMFGHSVPFMVQTAVTGGFSGASRAGANLVGRLGKKAAEGTIKKKIINAMGTTIDDVIEAGLITNTAGAGGTWANIAERKAGKINIKDGDYVFENGESWLGALYKGEVSSILELYTEKLGGHLEGKLSLTKGLDKIGASRVSNVLLAAKNSDLYRGASTVMRQFGLNGYLPEVLEEEANLVLNSLLVGDNSLSELYNPRTQLDIFGGMLLTVGTMQAIPGTIATAGYVKNQYQMNRADRRAADVFGEDWEAVKEALDNATNEKVAGVVFENLRDNENQNKALLDYYKRMMIMRGYNIGTVKNETAPDIEEAYTDGFSQEPTGANALNAMTGYDIARQEVARALGLAEGDDVDVFLNGRTAEDIAKGDTDVENAVKNYQQQKARMEGIQEKFQQTREQQFEESDRSVQTNDNNGMVYATQLEDELVYITGGNVVLNEDGTIDVNNSSEALYVKFPDEHVEMTSPDKFTEVFTEDRTEDLKAAKRAEIDAKWKAEFDTAEAQSVEQEAGIQSTDALADNTTDNVALTGDNVAPVAPVELPNVPDFFRLGGTNYEVASRNDDGSVDVVVDGKRETLPAGTDYSTLMPTDKKGEVRYEQIPVERTHEYFVQKVKDDEARAEMIEKRRKKAEVERKKFDKKPDPGFDPDAYEAKMTQWEADKKAAQAKVDYWNEVAKRETEITRSETREAVENIKPDVVEETADEFIANQLAGIKITPESFKRETGLSNAEQAQAVGVISNDGVSVERAAEIITENYDSELKALGFTGDMQDVRDIIIDVLSQGNPRSYARKGREAREAENVDQQRAEAEAWSMGTFNMSLDELYVYEETAQPRMIRDYEGFDENEYYNNLAENYENDTTRESESTGRGGELLQGEQPVPAGGTPVAGQRNEGGTVSDDVQGGGQNGVAQEEVPVNEPELTNDVKTEDVNQSEDNLEMVAEGDAPGKSGVYADNQGNPVDADGKLIVDEVNSIDEITDEDFETPTRNVQLPVIPENVANAIGTNGRPVVIKRNVFEKNGNTHVELEPEDSRNILRSALYNPNLVGSTQPIRRPDYKVAIRTGEQNAVVVLDVYQEKDFVEIVGWRMVNEKGLAKMQRQTEREGGQFLILSPNDGSAAALSALPLGLSSASEDRNSVSNSQENAQKSGEIAENGGESKKENAESRKEKEESTPEIQEPRSVEENLDNGDKRITNYNSRGEVATVAIERDGKVVSVDSYDEGVLFEHTEYDGNGKATSVTRYDKQGNVVGTQRYEDGKAKTPMQKLADRILNRTEEKRRIPLRERARELEAQVGVKANIIESIDEVKNREARKRIAAGEAVAGWYSGGQVYLYMPNIKDRREIELTYVHEVVAHHGVKKLLGDRFNEFLDGVWNMMSEADRARMLAYVGANENPTLQDMRAAADEYVAELAEKMNLGELEQSTWDKIVDWFKKILENIGFENLTKEDIESMLKASYSNLKAERGKGKTGSTENDFRARMTFHGSGAQFDRFDHAFMGTGEGAQAFGWGTYVTEVEGIGRTYAESTSGNIFKSGFGDFYLKKIREGLAEGKSFEEIKQNLLEFHAHLYERVDGNTEMYGEFISDYEKLQSLKEEDLPKRNLYSVEIPDDNGSNYLHWEDVVPKKVETAVKERLLERLSEGQGEAYKSDLKQELDDVFRYSDFDGASLYKNISAYLGGDKQASLFLSDMGFVGISYPAEAMTGGRADGARNYVIFNENDAQIKDRTMFRIAEVNDKFNSELESLNEENADKVVLNVGNPSPVLLSAGVEDRPMKLYGNKIIKKAKKHGFKIQDLKDLPSAVADPIAVFDNYQQEGNRSILTELRTADGNILATVDLGKGMDIDFNIISSAFGKSDNKIVSWINKGFATYINKEKALDYLHLSAPIAEASDKQELSSAAKIVESFENPTVESENSSENPQDAESGIRFRKKDSERRLEKKRINDAIDTAAGFVTVGGKKQATKNRLKKEAERKQLAKEMYSSVLKGDFNDVTLSQIDKFIEDATPANPFGRRISQRLPQRMERALRQGARTNAVDALFSRICESTVPANERFSEAGRREIEDRKKELLKGWAIATGNWHTDLKEFTDDTEPIGEGKDSKVYMSKDGNSVIKASKGKPFGKKFRPDIDNIPLFNDVFKNSRYEILGYGEIDGQFIRILKQDFIDFAESTPLTPEERKEYMGKLGFKPLNKDYTAFSNGEIVIADLQKSNIVKDAAGNISVIDADAKLHTKDVGGDYTYPPVEEDLPEQETRFRKVGNTENNSIFASTYKTEDGKDINYTSERTEGYGVQDDGIGNSNSGSRRSILQRQTSTGVPGADSGLDAEKGEFCVVERVFTENGAFNFTSGEKIESADDVAYIFSALEDAAKEHSFVVYVKDGMPTVIELGMGSFNATMVDVPTASLAYSRINPDHVYFVHNHPSGNLICSSQDVAMLRVFEDMSDVPVTGVIINLKTGKYGTFDTERHSVIGEKRVPEKEERLAVHTLDKQIFAPDYDPMAQPLVRGSQDVAQFLNSQRMGDRPKVSFLILSRANRIIGNIHTPFTNITTDVEAVARYINERVIQFGGENAILYGDFAITSVEGMDFRLLQNAMDRFGKTKLLDVVRVEGNFTRSANDMGLLYEPEAEYKDGQTMFRTVEDVIEQQQENEVSLAWEAVTYLGEKLNSPVKIMDNLDSVPENRRNRKGWFDPKTGEVVVVMPNLVSSEDAVQTVLHEAVGYKGLSGILGERFNELLDGVYKGATPSVKRAINDRFFEAIRNGRAITVREATERVIADSEVPGVKEQLRGVVRDATGVELPDGELQYLLWKNVHRGADGVVETVLDRAKEAETGTGDTRFRRAEPVRAVDTYNKNVKGFKNKFKEGWYDEMRSLKVAQEAIEKELGKEIMDSENVYLYANHIPSINKNKKEVFDNKYLKPFTSLLKRLYEKEVNGKKLDEKSLERYTNAKHGIERNREMSVKNALTEVQDGKKVFNEKAYKSWAQERDEVRKKNLPWAEEQRELDKVARKYGAKVRDYSGLTAIFDEDRKMKYAQISDAAYQYVADVEKALGNDVNKLWGLLKGMTDYSLNEAFESGMMSKATYEHIKQMYRYYVPLRGFTEQTAEDFFDYVEGDHSPLNAVVKTAYGRTSEADNIFATILNMANSAIVQGSKNRLKQRLLNLAMRSQTRLLSVDNAWYEKKGDTYEPVNYPDKANEYADFEERMKDKEKRGEVVRHRPGLDIGKKVAETWNKTQHAVRVKRNGREYVVWVNGEPTMANAINGLLREEIGGAIKTVNQFRSKMVTQYSPTFVFTNLLRDVQSASIIYAVRRGTTMLKEFEKNVASNATDMMDLYLKHKRGTLDVNNPKERYFKEFLENGGETGYTEMISIEKYEKKLKELTTGLNMKNGTRRAFKAVGGAVEFANRCVENLCRFSAYQTSREAGISILKSIEDAKEVSVNFNRKGSGAMKQKYAKALFMFLNPAVQSIAQRILLTKKYPKKMAAVWAGEFILGAAMPVLYSIISAALGDDDDEITGNYYNLSDYRRRSSLCLPLKDGVFHIPLSHESRVLFGLGELCTSVVMGHEKLEDAPIEALNTLAQSLPLNPVEGWMPGKNIIETMTYNFMPDAVKPIAEVAMNRDFAGNTVHNRTDFNEFMPEYMRGKRGTLGAYKKISKYLTSTDGYEKSFLNDTFGAVLNPSVMEHLMEGIFGGLYTFGEKAYKTGAWAFGDDEYAEFRNIPIASSFYTSLAKYEDTPTEGRTRRDWENAFRFYKDEVKGYDDKEKTAKNGLKYGEEGADLVLEQMERNGEVLMVDIFNDGNDRLKELYGASDAARKNRDFKRVEDIDQQIYAEKRNIVSLMEQLADDPMIGYTFKRNKIEGPYGERETYGDVRDAKIINDIQKELKPLYEEYKDAYDWGDNTKEEDLWYELDDIERDISDAKSEMKDFPEDVDELMAEIRELRAKAIELINNYRKDE